ncbi:hypothetical protein [Bacillus halotolerans]|uniref:hypothetical protein n=1 Tax=Bacillus halotolerans TaxID=260554 RepID=UPI00192B26DF|nr:hypothetical protein [Bacillus halotolerans]MBL4964000.1 hypothetical protein [Bacillus halotolerans]
MSTVLDGGYYAIKGFNFQYDHTIIRILEQTNELNEIEIEQTEDYSDENIIVQVKYKERANFSNSQVKKPLCQLLEIFKTDKRKPVLYAYFKNKEEQEVSLSLQDLNDIIGDCKIKNKQYSFEEELKTEFINQFRIIFTGKYQKQFEVLIEKIIKEFNCEEEEALIYYAQIYKYIEKKVVNNAPEDKHKRVCSKKEVKELITNSREVIFHSSYTQFLGKEKYYKFIYKRFFRETNINFHERIFLFELPENFEDTNLLIQLTRKIMERYYKKVTFGGSTIIKSPAPYIFFQNANDTVLKNMKTELLSEGIIFRDGFCFEGADFFLRNLLEESTPQNNIELKFINRYEYIKEIILQLQRTKKIYNLYLDKRIEQEGLDINHIKIEDFSDINEFLF